MRDDIRVREDVRLENGPMLPLSCGACGARVEVRKSSWDQTSIQWHAADVGRCVERRSTSAGPGANGAVFVGCTALREAVREAAVRGDLPVLDD
jgi:hypothetical protein